MAQRNDRRPDESDSRDESLRTELRDDSDALLDAVERIRRLEAEKRQVPMSSPAFHIRADEIEGIARGIFGLAQRERRDGEALDGPQHVSIDDEEPSESIVDNEPSPR